MVARALRVRDPVHGFIPYNEVEERVINSRVLQRLRGISQLALTSYVYPGARHSRFEHSLGVMHIAWRIGAKVELSKKECGIVRLAGLLHDIGHGPFSHVSDVPLSVMTQEGDCLPKGLLPNKIHEQITVDFIKYDKELRSILPEECREDVAGILHPSDWVKTPILQQIVSGPLDADKLDYLLRDALLAGVRYGVIDLERVLDCFTKIGKDDRHLAIRRDGIEAAEQVLIARYQMTRQVYGHKIRRITNAMLQRAILRAARDNSDHGKRIRRLYTYSGSDPQWRNMYLSVDDYWLMAQLHIFRETTPVGKLVRRIRDRRLLKEVYECRLEHLPAGVALRQKLIKDILLQKGLETEIAKALGVDRHLVIVDIRSHDNPLYRASDIALEEDIQVIDESGRDERLADMPESLTQKVKVEAEASLFVYLPVDQMERKKRQQEYKGLKKAVNDIMESWSKENA